MGLYTTTNCSRGEGRDIIMLAIVYPKVGFICFHSAFNSIDFSSERSKKRVVVFLSHQLVDSRDAIQATSARKCCFTLEPRDYITMPRRIVLPPTIYTFVGPPFEMMDTRLATTSRCPRKPVGQVGEGNEKENTQN
jgi:hypothetical protein